MNNLHLNIIAKARILFLGLFLLFTIQSVVPYTILNDYNIISCNFADFGESESEKEKEGKEDIRVILEEDRLLFHNTQKNISESIRNQILTDNENHREDHHQEVPTPPPDNSLAYSKGLS